MPRDYYDILGISRLADAEEIKQAFRAKARLLHPDLNPHPEALARFQELQMAYEVLSDPDKRARYDQQGTQWEAAPVNQYEERPVSTQTPDHGDHRRQSWNPFSKYDPQNVKPDTDYAHFSRLNTIIGVITLIFASTFLFDFFLPKSEVETGVLSVMNKGINSGKSEDFGYRIVETDAGSFSKAAEKPELVPGERIVLESSFVYGFKRYKRAEEVTFRTVSNRPIIVYVLAIIVYIASLSAVFNKKKPERKFNAGIIALFCSIMLLYFALT